MQIEKSQKSEKSEKKKESCVVKNCSEHLVYPILKTEESGFKKTKMTDKLVHLCKFAEELISDGYLIGEGKDKGALSED